VVPDRRDALAVVRSGRGRLDAALAGHMAGFARRVGAERRALEGLRPEARLAAARERAGYLLDRATALVTLRLAGDRRSVERAGGRMGPCVAVRIATAGARLDATRGSLAALGPEATLARGYAIVRRAEDESIVRDPAQAPPGTVLHIRVAAGELGARVESDD